MRKEEIKEKECQRDSERHHLCHQHTSVANLDEGELDSFDDENLTTPFQSHCCFYMHKSAYS